MLLRKTFQQTNSVTALYWRYPSSATTDPHTSVFNRLTGEQALQVASSLDLNTDSVFPAEEGGRTKPVLPATPPALNVAHRAFEWLRCGWQESHDLLDLRLHRQFCFRSRSAP